MEKKRVEEFLMGLKQRYGISDAELEQLRAMVEKGDMGGATGVPMTTSKDKNALPIPPDLMPPGFGLLFRALGEREIGLGEALLAIYILDMIESRRERRNYGEESALARKVGELVDMLKREREERLVRALEELTEAIKKGNISGKDEILARLDGLRAALTERPRKSTFGEKVQQVLEETMLEQLKQGLRNLGIKVPEKATPEQIIGKVLDLIRAGIEYAKSTGEAPAPKQVEPIPVPEPRPKAEAGGEGAKRGGGGGKGEAGKGSGKRG